MPSHEKEMPCACFEQSNNGKEESTDLISRYRRCCEHYNDDNGPYTKQQPNARHTMDELKER